MMKFIHKVFFSGLLIIPLGLFLPVVFDLMSMKFFVYPSAENLNYIETLTDSIWKGQSSIIDFAYDSEKLLFKYILKKSVHPDPNVFIIFWLDKHKPFVDLSHYTSITLHIKEATPQDVTLFVKTFEPGISSYEHQDAVLLKHNSKIITLSPSKKIYTINMNDLITSEWWLDRYAPGSVKSREELGRESFKKVVSLDLHFIHTRNTPFTGKEESLIIDEISFSRPLSHMSIGYSIFLFIYYTIIITLCIVFRRKIFFFPGGDKGDFSLHDREKELKTIIEYIQHHYNDPEISTIQLQNTLGIPSLRIFNLIKEEYNFSFKQFINTIRIEESKRLLKESDLRVVEISTIIGFNDSSYFNKVFKQMEGLTPTEYREKK